MSYVLRIDEHGKAELLRDDETVWASDSDPDVLEVFGRDEFEKEDDDELVEYLVEDRELLTWDEAEEDLEIEPPGVDPESDDYQEGLTP
jgi:hypothetical protein